MIDSARMLQANQIRQRLRKAQQCIAPSHIALKPGEHSRRIEGLPSGTLEEFELFLFHNEFQLAWGSLTASAARTHAENRCWIELVRVAVLIKSYQRHDDYFLSLTGYAYNYYPKFRLALNQLLRDTLSEDERSALSGIVKMQP